jgi:hypothetical protein
MKLTTKQINSNELQDYLDKYKSKIKFIFPSAWVGCNINGSCIQLVIEEDE